MIERRVKYICNGHVHVHVHVSEHTVYLELVVIAMSFRLDITARTASYSVCYRLALTCLVAYCVEGLTKIVLASRSV